MLWNVDAYVLDIFIFRSIVVVAAIVYIYKCTENARRYYLSLLLITLVLLVIFIDSYFCRQCRSEPWQPSNIMLLRSSSGGQPLYEVDPKMNRSDLDELLFPPLPSIQYEKPDIMKPPSKEVMLVTPWLAPVIWTGTFNRDILNKEFQNRNCTIGLSVFALGGYWKMLKRFLESADKFFMVGHKVNYYVYSDQAAKLECNTSHADRTCTVYKTSSYASKARVFMKRMEILHHNIKSKLIDVKYLVCVDVDIVFHDDVGVEILDDLVAALHPGYYKGARNGFPYDRRKSCEAYIPFDEGDFYYQANFFAGTAERIYHLTKSCDEAVQKDDSKGIVAAWHDESHFNKYLLYHKPTKILSPEYIWSWNMGKNPEIKTIRVIHGAKNI